VVSLAVKTKLKVLAVTEYDLHAIAAEINAAVTGGYGELRGVGVLAVIFNDGRGRCNSLHLLRPRDITLCKYRVGRNNRLLKRPT
jgi:hypothetical protein